jgi:uncharacterized protein YkwD
MKSAKRQSKYQATNRQMTHDSDLPLFDRFTSVGFQAQAVAENVAWTGSMNIDRVMSMWMSSSGTLPAATILCNNTLAIRPLR